MPRTPSKNSPKKTVKRELAAKRTNTARGKKNAEVREVRILLNSPELGSSGLQAQSGFIREAYTSSLQWPSAYPIYNKMRRSTPEVVMIRNAFTTWCRGLSLNVTLPEKPTDDDKKYQEFVYSVFEDMEGGLDKFLDTLVNHVPFLGWGWWEVVAGRRNPDWKPPKPKNISSDEDVYEDDWRSEYDDDLVGIRRLAWRSAGTFSEWEIDDRTKRLQGMWQEDYPNPKVLLPLKDSLHITFGDPNNPEGLTPLEAVYRLERIHYGLSVIMGIGYEHAAGYLNVQKTEVGTLSSDDKALVKQAAMAIMTAQEGNYALWPYGLNGEIRDIGFAAGGSLISAMQHYSTLMLSIYNMQWMALNTMTGTGSFAAANDSSSMSVMSYNAMMEGFAEQLDNQVGKRLFEWNKHAFPNITKRPKIGFTKIDKSVALNEMSSFVSAMRDILPLSEDDLKSIRKRTGFLSEVLPTKQELVKQAEEKAEIAAAAQPQQEEQSWGGGSDWGSDTSSGNDWWSEEDTTDEEDTELSLRELQGNRNQKTPRMGISSEMAMNTLARRYYEMHYGGADGKQPHPSGTSQDTHGIKKYSSKTTKIKSEPTNIEVDEEIKKLANKMASSIITYTPKSVSHILSVFRNITQYDEKQYTDTEFAKAIVFLKKERIIDFVPRYDESGNVIENTVSLRKLVVGEDDEEIRKRYNLTENQLKIISLMRTSPFIAHPNGRQIAIPQDRIYEIFKRRHGDASPAYEVFVGDLKALTTRGMLKQTYQIRGDGSPVDDMMFSLEMGVAFYDKTPFGKDESIVLLSEKEKEIMKGLWFDTNQEIDSRRVSVSGVGISGDFVTNNPTMNEDRLKGADFLKSASVHRQQASKFRDEVIDAYGKKGAEEFRAYQNDHFKSINRTLRGTLDKYDTEYSQEGIQIMQDAIDKYGVNLDDGTLLFRGSYIRDFDKTYQNYRDGLNLDFSDKGFFSTSADFSQASEFGGMNEKWNESVFFVILANEDVKVAPLGFHIEYLDESEYIFNSGQKFDILAMHDDMVDGIDNTSRHRFTVILSPK